MFYCKMGEKFKGTSFSPACVSKHLSCCSDDNKTDRRPVTWSKYCLYCNVIRFIGVLQVGSGGVEDSLSSITKVSKNTDGVGNGGKQMHCYGAEERGGLTGVEALASGDGFSRYYRPEQDSFSSQNQQDPMLDDELLGDLRFDVLSPPSQPCLQDKIVSTAMKEKRYPFHSSSLELLSSYGKGLKRLNSERKIGPSDDSPSRRVANQELSTEDIMRIAGARFIHSSTQTVDVFAMLDNPFDLSFSGLSEEVTKNVELAELLLAAAEKVGNQQFERASGLLNCCDCLSSKTGNPVQRVVYYFSEALRERINRARGRITKQLFDLDEALMAPSSTILASHLETPFSQVAHFAGMQAIVENVAQAKRIHVIDLAVRGGMQWAVLMQALASRTECSVELFKITAIGTTLKHLIEETSKRLASFAQSISLPFSFNIVMVSDLLNLKKDLFQIDADETVAVFSPFFFRTLLPIPDRLESILKVIKDLKPSIMVVTEVEANHNSPVFVNRFIETLFYYSAYYDCLGTCMKQDVPNRMTIESFHFGEGIKNIVATEGGERTTRNVKIIVWRAFFARFGMQEAELSTSSLYQANLIVQRFACGSSCTLEMDGKSLILGWKGSSLHSLSAWKFISEKQIAS